MNVVIETSSYFRKDIVLSLLFCLLISLAWYQFAHPLIVLAAGCLPFAILAVLRWPILVILAFVIFSFFRIHEAYPALYSLRIPQLLALASLATLAWHIGLSGKIRIFWTREMSYLACFALLCFISVVLASNRGLAMAYFNGVFSKIILMSFAICWMLRCGKDFVMSAALFIVAGFAIAIVALQNAALGIEMVEGTRVTIGRSFGSVLGDPNDLALTLLFPLSFAASFSLHRIAWWQRVCALVAFSALLMAMIATQSRGGILGMLSIFAVLGWRRVENKALLIVLAMAVGLLLLSLAGIDQRSSGGALESGIDESSMGRIYAWQAAFGMALAHPFTGVGLDNFYSNYYFYSSHWDGKNHAVHSTWFGILAETGFTGIIVFALMIKQVVMRALENLNLIQERQLGASLIGFSEALFSGLLATIVAGTFLTQGFTWPFYILFALTISCSQWLQLKPEQKRVSS
ncbi:oligosaccharide repeat unit polymerase [Alginatibacterium sediminis]|uniref:Oligosaccharide repeat unit polymerase n=1 Tax=Alginatibacterium sediminis TaxID=2164068 RepID=A0A420EDP4_9ALTE|nr:O-antigen ligase family protein [Alginatibacterium sediminis]RKF18790.1 oligosaccharide repeat unit polymerase [Alginatibacterium sediminis]